MSGAAYQHNYSSAQPDDMKTATDKLIDDRLGVIMDKHVWMSPLDEIALLDIVARRGQQFDNRDEFLKYLEPKKK